jgi:opacity protein-like surface antigen
MTLRPYRVLAVVCLALAIAVPSYAQDQRAVEVSFGYQLLSLRIDDEDETFALDETLNKGWYADFAANIGPLFAAVAQVGGSYKTSEESETIGGVTATVTADLKVHNFLAGVRVGPRRSAISPYAEFLVGGVRGSVDLSASVTGAGAPISFNESDSGTDFALQFGGGVTAWLSRNVGIRGSLGYLRLIADEGGTNVLRATGGVSFGF